MKRKKVARKSVKPAYDVPADWWYLLPDQVSLRQIYDLCREDEGLRVEFWEEAGALEIEVPGEGSLDLEESPCDLGDEEGNDFLKEHGICTVFAATIRQDAYGALKPVMEGLSGRMGGFFCGDTEDFTPIIKNP